MLGVFLPWKLVILVCILGGALCVQASGTTGDAAAALGSLHAAAGASLLVSGAALMASRRTRDQDKLVIFVCAPSVVRSVCKQLLRVCWSQAQR